MHKPTDKPAIRPTDRPVATRMPWVNAFGVTLGLVAAGATGFAGLSLFGRARGAIVAPAVSPSIVERVVEGLGSGIRGGLRAVQGPMAGISGTWKSAEGEEIIRGAQKTLVVNNVAGPVRVTGWDDDAVRVRYVKHARTEADLKDLVVEIRSEGDSVSVRPVYEPIGGLARFGSVEIEISVPARIAGMEIRTVSGEIVVQDLRGAADKDLTTVSGAVTVRGDGELTAKTTSGSIEIDFSGQSLHASTVSGRIRGSIRSLGSGGAEVGTVSGSVDLEAWSGLDASLDFRSLSGSMSCDFPVAGQEQSRGKLRGTVASGAVPLKVSTTSGSIRLTRM